MKIKLPLLFQQNSDRSTRKSRPIKLGNLSSDCYLHAALQGISSGDKFFNDMRILVSQYPPELKNLNLFYNLLSILNGGKSSIFMISNNKIFKNWNKSSQQDSFELLTFLFNEVYNEIRKYKEDRMEISKNNFTQWVNIRLPMRLVFSNDIHCECGLVNSSPLQFDLAFHIPVSIHETCFLQSLIDKYFVNEPIDSYICDNQKCIGGAYKYTRIMAPIPNTICIHLQKLCWNGTKLVKIKNKVHFEKTITIKREFCFESQHQDSEFKPEQVQSSTVHNYSQNVDVKSEYLCRSISSGWEILNPSNHEVDVNSDRQFPVDSPEIRRKSNSLSDGDQNSTNLCEEYVMIKESDVENFFNRNDRENNESQNIKFQANFEENNSNIEEQALNNEVFTLKSVIVHSGSANSGHYTCYKVVNSIWFLTNDFVVKKVREDEVLNCDPYILFYEKI